jgi:alkanesulfonate monooxygenase SsuD/methylene tetrahydromethanopterin reductase-like flavin-dependent oxidoreductase (luciferase family)
LGFDSLWVRDHLIFHPHGIEGVDHTFLEPMVTLAFVAGATRTIGLGTATVIPHRHPIHLAQSVASLGFLAHRSIDLGVGAGNDGEEFEAIGLGDVNRPELMREHIDIVRRLWGGSPVRYQSSLYEFRDVQLRPVPDKPPAIWWGGSTPAATRLAVDYCNGWLPGRINFPTYRTRIDQIRQRENQARSGPISVGAVPITSIGRTHEDAVEPLDVRALLKNANAQRYWVRPPKGEFASLADLEGSVLAGTPEDVATDLRRYQEIGCDLLIFDLRLRFADWLEQIEMISSEVLPLLASRGSQAVPSAIPVSEADDLRDVLRAVAAERGWEPSDDLVASAASRYKEIAIALRNARERWLGEPPRKPR